jgi:endonuclease YncB( thermonuclease family)
MRQTKSSSSSKKPKGKTRIHLMYLPVRIVPLCLIVFLSTEASADYVTGKVVKVVDGDTIYVLDASHKQHKIRLAGIDAPERNQAYGNASRKHLAVLVAGRQVRIEYQKYDRYGRIVGKVIIDGTDACLEQVKAGFAWHYKKYQDEQTPQDRQLYAAAEEQARQEKIGLWKDERPIAPWEWRKLPK